MYNHGESTGDDEWYSLAVHELIAADLDATLALWRVLAGNSSVSVRASYQAGPDEPLTLLLPEQDILTREDWRWMLRLVDASGAIAARGFPAGLTATAHLDIVDDFAPWNAGPHVLEVKDGEGQLTPGGDGTVAITINGLAPLYSGMTSQWALARHGFLRGGSEQDLAALAAAFAGPAPWMVDFF